MKYLNLLLATLLGCAVTYPTPAPRSWTYDIHLLGNGIVQQCISRSDLAVAKLVAGTYVVLEEYENLYNLKKRSGSPYKGKVVMVIYEDGRVTIYHCTERFTKAEETDLRGGYLAFYTNEPDVLNFAFHLGLYGWTRTNGYGKTERADCGITIFPYREFAYVYIGRLGASFKCAYTSSVPDSEKESTIPWAIQYVKQRLSQR